MNIFLPAFATENWSRETGSAVPSRVSLIISILRLNLVLTYGIPPEFRGGVHLSILNRHTPSCQSQVYRVTQLRADGVHCRRESAGTGAVVLKVVPVTSAAFSGTIDQLICASLSHTHYWFEVGMLKVPAAITIHYYTVCPTFHLQISARLLPNFTAAKSFSPLQASSVCPPKTTESLSDKTAMSQVS